MDFSLRAVALVAASAFCASFSAPASAGLPFFNKKNKAHDEKVAIKLTGHPLRPRKR